MLIDIAGIVVVITGASRGIGAELVRVFAKEGAHVVVNYNSSEKLAYSLLDEISSYNTNCIAVKADVTKQEEVSRLYGTVISKYGKVDILINNAGICDDNLIQLMPEEQWRHVIDINLTGAYLCSRIFSKIMINQKKGKIINISSLKGQEGCVGQTNYAASKAGLIGFTKSLAKELGRYSIPVNAVCPGFIVTDLNRHNKQKQDVAKSKSLLTIDHSMEDLTNFLVYMSSERFKGISGQVYNLDSRLL